MTIQMFQNSKELIIQMSLHEKVLQRKLIFQKLEFK